MALKHGTYESGVYMPFTRTEHVVPPNILLQVKPYASEDTFPTSVISPVSPHAATLENQLITPSTPLMYTTSIPQERDSRRILANVPIAAPVQTPAQWRHRNIQRKTEKEVGVEERASDMSSSDMAYVAQTLRDVRVFTDSGIKKKEMEQATTLSDDELESKTFQSSVLWVTVLNKHLGETIIQDMWSHMLSSTHIGYEFICVKSARSVLIMISGRGPMVFSNSVKGFLYSMLMPATKRALRNRQLQVQVQYLSTQARTIVGFIDAHSHDIYSHIGNDSSKSRFDSVVFGHGWSAEYCKMFKESHGAVNGLREGGDGNTVNVSIDAYMAFMAPNIVMRGEPRGYRTSVKLAAGKSDRALLAASPEVQIIPIFVAGLSKRNSVIGEGNNEGNFFLYFPPTCAEAADHKVCEKLVGKYEAIAAFMEKYDCVYVKTKQDWEGLRNMPKFVIIDMISSNAMGMTMEDVLHLCERNLPINILQSGWRMGPGTTFIFIDKEHPFKLWGIQQQNGQVVMNALQAEEIENSITVFPIVSRLGAHIRSDVDELTRGHIAGLMHIRGRQCRGYIKEVNGWTDDNLVEFVNNRFYTYIEPLLFETYRLPGDTEFHVRITPDVMQDVTVRRGLLSSSAYEMFLRDIMQALVFAGRVISIEDVQKFRCPAEVRTWLKECLHHVFPNNILGKALVKELLALY